MIQLAKAIVDNPIFLSKDITGDGKPETFCNWAVRLIAEGAFGYTEFNGKVANQIYDICNKKWNKVDATQAQKHANEGRFVLAAQKGTPGHVCVVIPGDLSYSGKWEKQAPSVANVGRENKITTANWAFRDEPDYYVL